MTENDKADVQALLQEAARRFNPYFMRDSLPHQVSIKAFWLALQAAKPQALDDIGLSVFSQNNEDGILLYLFSRIGFRSRKCIEIGCNIDQTTQGLPEGNTVNLIVNFGFHGLIIDMDKGHIGALRHFFSNCLQTKHFHHSDGWFSPILVEALVTPEEINDMAVTNGFGGEIDLLSIDIDGNDVNVFSATSAFSPRVVMIEVNNRLPFETSLFAGALPDWKIGSWNITFRQSCGSSLLKIVETAKAKGYVFAGMNSNLINAFLVRRDAFEGSGLAEARPEDYFSHRFRPPESMGSA